MWRLYAGTTDFGRFCVAMAKDKKFDAVELKWAIQRRIDEEYADMEPEAARAAQRRRIAQDPMLGPFLERVRTVP